MMKTQILACMVLVAAPLASRASTTDDIRAAVDKLSEAPNYSWSTTSEGGNRRFAGGTTTGVAENGGYAVITHETPRGTLRTVERDGKRAVETPEGWLMPDAMRQGARGPGRNEEPPGGPGRESRRPGGMRPFMGAGALPAEELQRVVDAVQDWEPSGDAFKGTLPADFFARGMPGRRGGQPNAAPAGTGTATIWIQDGIVTKYQLHMEMSFTGRNGEERNIDRTTTTELTEVGTTTVDVPAEAREKLDS